MTEPTPTPSSAIPVNVLTGFLGSGKTTLLQRLLQSAQMNRTAVLINELGEIGLDHLLVQQVDEAVVLLQSGCICCSIRDDLKSALRSLLSKRERAEIPAFDRVVIETTGIADPAPILYTISGEPVIRHHFELANVITTVDAVNSVLHLSNNPEGVKQVAAADRLVITKTDIADADQVAAVRETLARLNPTADVIEAVHGEVEADRLLATSHLERAVRPQQWTVSNPDTLAGLRRHSEAIGSVCIALEAPLDWTAFGVWLSMLLNRHGDNLLRVKGILRVQGSAAPVFINAVQHIVHPPQHLERWPTDDHRSRIVFITRGIDHGLLRRSLAAFARAPVSELAAY